MFENIQFFFHRSNGETHEIIQANKGNQIEQQKILPEPEKLTFMLSGNSYYLLQLPLSPQRKQYLMYLQSFSFMDTGAAYYTRRRNYSSFLLLYTYEGNGELIYRNQKYILRKGDGFLIDCEEEHYYATIGKHWQHADLHFYGGQAAFFYKENFGNKSPIFHCLKQEVFQNQLEKMLRIHTDSSTDRDFRFSFEMERMLFFILNCQENIHAPQEVPENIQKLQQYPESSFAQDLSLEDMAEFCGVTKYHLCRQFKKYIGFTPKEYMLHLRLLQAKFLLQSTSIPCYKIGNMVGFSNEANFIQHFRSEVGMTPGAFRKLGVETADS